MIDCVHLCLRESSTCRSINFGKKQNNEEEQRCQLNNSTKETHFEKFTRNPAFDYLELKQVQIKTSIFPSRQMQMNSNICEYL
jgi:hypothetical protein